MKKQKVIVTIPKPCSQSWEEMKPVDGCRRYCDVCQKNVTDFAMLTDAEILNIYKANNNSFPCGRFLNSQLDRELIPAAGHVPRITILFKRIAASLLFFQAMATTGWSQQVKLRTHQQSKQTKKKVVTHEGMIWGRVMDHITNEPLAGICVAIKGTKLSNTTDAGGRFEILIMGTAADTPGKELVLYVDSYMPGSTMPGTTIPEEVVVNDTLLSSKEILLYRYPVDMTDAVKVVDYRPIIVRREYSLGGPMGGIERIITLKPTVHHTLRSRIWAIFHPGKAKALKKREEQRNNPNDRVY